MLKMPKRVALGFLQGAAAVQFHSFLQTVVGEVEGFHCEHCFGVISSVFESACLVEVLVCVVAVLDAGRLSDEGGGLYRLVMGCWSNFGVYALHLGLLDQKPVPGRTENS